MRELCTARGDPEAERMHCFHSPSDAHPSLAARPLEAISAAERHQQIDLGVKRSGNGEARQTEPSG